MSNNPLLALAVALSMLAGTSSLAAEISPSDIIIVTATRTAIPLDDAIVPVTVITREDIELSLATDLAELLRFEAGVDIGRNGGPGQATSTFLRGTDSNHTLVLIDGVRMNPGTIGGAAVQHVSPEVIERIEIVKGARSALFGTDAIGGVINIITRRATDAYFESGAGVGSFNSRSAYVSAGNHGSDGEFGITVDWQSTNGFSPRSDADVDRGYDNISANFYAARNFGSNEISLRHWRAEGNVEYLQSTFNPVDPFRPVDQDFDNSTTAITLETSVSDAATSKLIVSHMQDNITQNQVADFVESDRLSVDWQYTHAFTDHTLTAGLFASDENAKSLSFGTGFDEDTGVRAAFLQDQWTHGPHRAFAALRLTDHDTFGNQTTWNAEYAIEVSDAWTVSAGLGRAFRAPDATDRFGFGGDPQLQPEVSKEAQLGLRFAPGRRHRVDIEFYASNIDDLIEFDFQTFMLKNIDQAEIRGAQLGYAYQGDTFSLRAEFVKQEADNRTTGARLLRRAEESMTLSYVQDFGEHRFGISMLASGDREDFGSTRLAGYVITNLTGQIRLGKAWRLNARIENLFDRRYETAANFRMQTRSGFVELRYRWQ